MIECVICGATLPDVELAVEAGWLPSFWVDEQEIGPACDRCAQAYLTVAADGEFEPLPQHQQVTRCWAALQRENAPTYLLSATTSRNPYKKLKKSSRFRFS